MTDFFRGFSSFFQAFGFIFQHRMARWYLVPAILWVVLFFGTTFSLAAWLEPYVELWLENTFGIQIDADSSHESKNWLKILLQYSIAWSLKIILWYAFSRFMKYIILIITSPLMAYLSEKTEEILTGNEYPFDFAQLLKDSLRGILITIRNLFIELTFMALAFGVAFVMPALVPFTTAGLFIVSSYFMGFSMFDYITERQKMNIKDSVNWMRKNKSMVTGLGVAYNLMSFIPVADWMIAPVNGSVGAVLASQNGLRQSEQQSSAFQNSVN